MPIQPNSIAELSQTLADAHSGGQAVDSLDLSRLNKIVGYTPEDMTVTVQAGLSLAGLQSHLREANQWLPIDPPNPGTLVIGDLLATNASGPRRFGYGTIREHLIGIKVLLADGTLIKSGGQVVKNVAGYDLCKLFVGSFGTLGVIVEASFKVLPIPECETLLGLHSTSAGHVHQVLQTVKRLPITPALLELHNLAAPLAPNQTDASVSSYTIVVGFAGTRAETDWQTQQMSGLDFTPNASPTGQGEFWDETPRVLSVAPSRLMEAAATIPGQPFVARAGNGIIYHHGPAPGPPPRVPVALMEQIKNQFDPKHILPSLRL